MAFTIISRLQDAVMLVERVDLLKVPDPREGRDDSGRRQPIADRRPPCVYLETASLYSLTEVSTSKGSHYASKRGYTETHTNRDRARRDGAPKVIRPVPPGVKILKKHSKNKQNHSKTTFFMVIIMVSQLFHQKHYKTQ